jgi:2-dehydropantoate 2-reductase
MNRIAIIGAGAIGSVLGVCLSRAGEDVTLIGRSAHVSTIRQNGLQMDGALGSFTVQLPAAERLNFQPDLTFLTVKTQDVPTALQTNQAFLRAAPLVTFQNGVRSDELAAEIVPQPQIISAVVNISASYLAPGKVTVVYPGPLIVGRPFGAPDDAQLESVAALLSKVVPTRVSANIQGMHWLKLIFNLNNALPALLDANLHEVYADAYLRQLAVRLMREGLSVVGRAGIRLESLPEASVARFRLIGLLPTRLAGLLLAISARRIKTDWPLFGSTLQSLRRGRPTEIDYLNGEIVRLGEKAHTPTPLNAAIVDMVHRVERTGRFWTATEIRSHLRAA